MGLVMFVALGFALAMVLTADAGSPVVRISEDCTKLVVSDPQRAEEQWERFIDRWLEAHGRQAADGSAQGSVVRATSDYVRTLMGPNCTLVEGHAYYPAEGTTPGIAAIWLLLFKPMTVAFEQRGVPMPTRLEPQEGEWTHASAQTDDLWWEIADMHGLDLDAVNAVLVEQG